MLFIEYWNFFQYSQTQKIKAELDMQIPPFRKMKLRKLCVDNVLHQLANTLCFLRYLDFILFKSQ